VEKVCLQSVAQEIETERRSPIVHRFPPELAKGLSRIQWGRALNKKQQAAFAATMHGSCAS